MTDRELLEAAAKAAGLNWRDWTPTIFASESDRRAWPYDWNPLTDDGDALRLAVKLGIRLRCVDMDHAEVDSGSDESQMFWEAVREVCT